MGLNIFTLTVDYMKNYFLENPLGILIHCTKIFHRIHTRNIKSVRGLVPLIVQRKIFSEKSFRIPVFYVRTETVPLRRRPLVSIDFIVPTDSYKIGTHTSGLRSFSPSVTSQSLPIFLFVRSENEGHQ